MKISFSYFFPFSDGNVFAFRGSNTRNKSFGIDLQREIVLSLVLFTLFASLSQRSFALGGMIGLVLLTHAPEMVMPLLILTATTGTLGTGLSLMILFAIHGGLGMPTLLLLYSLLTFVVILSSSLMLSQLYAITSTILTLTFVLTGNEGLFVSLTLTTQLLALLVAYFWTVNAKVGLESLLLVFVLLKPLILASLFTTMPSLPLALTISSAFTALVMLSLLEARLLIVLSSAITGCVAFNTNLDSSDWNVLFLGGYTILTLLTLTSFQPNLWGLLLILVCALGFPVCTVLAGKLFFIAISDAMDLTLVLASYLAGLTLLSVLLRGYALSPTSAGWLLLVL